MGDYDVSRRKRWSHLAKDIQKCIIVGDKNLNEIAHLGQLGRRAHKIRNGSGVAIPNKRRVALMAEILGDAASDNTESDHPNVFPRSTRHENSAAFCIWPSIQPAIKMAVAQSRSWLLEAKSEASHWRSRDWQRVGEQGHPESNLSSFERELREIINRDGADNLETLRADLVDGVVSCVPVTETKIDQVDDRNPNSIQWGMIIGNVLI